VRARQRNLLEIQYRLFLPVIAKHNFVAVARTRLEPRAVPAEPGTRRLPGARGVVAGSSAFKDRVVGFRLILEDARFLARHTLPRCDADQMVRREIQEPRLMLGRTFQSAPVENCFNSASSDGVVAGPLHARINGVPIFPARIVENRASFKICSTKEVVAGLCRLSGDANQASVQKTVRQL